MEAIQQKSVTKRKYLNISDQMRSSKFLGLRFRPSAQTRIIRHSLQYGALICLYELGIQFSAKSHAYPSIIKSTTKGLLHLSLAFPFFILNQIFYTKFHEYKGYKPYYSLNYLATGLAIAPFGIGISMLINSKNTFPVKVLKGTKMALLIGLFGLVCDAIIHTNKIALQYGWGINKQESKQESIESKNQQDVTKQISHESKQKKLFKLPFRFTFESKFYQTVNTQQMKRK